MILPVRRRSVLVLLAGTILLCLASLVIHNLPPIHDRLARRPNNLRVAIKRRISRPEEVVFTHRNMLQSLDPALRRSYSFRI